METYNRGYKFRLLPNNEQIILLAKTFGCARFIWNKMLNYAEEFYKENGKRGFTTPAKYKEEFPWLKEVDSLALANVQLNLEKAYKAFLRKKSKHPRYKGKKDSYQSYTTNNQKGSIRIENNKIKLPKIGFVNFIQHREIKDNEKIKSCTITKSPSGKYYVSIIVEGIREKSNYEIDENKFIGLDYSMSKLYVDDKGEIANYPKFYRKAEKKLKKLGRNVSRKQKGSNNRHKARLKLAKYHEYVSNKRNDFLHKLSKNLVEKYDVVVTEDLNMKALSQALKFGKSVNDNGYGRFINLLTYKLEERGKKLIKVDRFFPSSKTCSNCNEVKQNLELKERIYECSACGYVEDRDINAAKNIKTAGMAGLAWSNLEVA